MKNVTLSLLLGLCAFSLHAQRQYVPQPADLDHLLTTTTYVVLEESPMSDFNFEIKAVMPMEWNLTKYEFIKLSEFEEKAKNSNASFLYITNVTFDRDKTESRYVFLHLSLGGGGMSINDLRDIVYVPLGYSSADPENYIYKLGIMVRFMQKHIHLLQQDPSLISSNMFRHYNTNMPDVKSKTLYLVADDLAKDVATEARIKQVYPHKFKLATRDEIKEAIEKRDENVVLLHKVGPEGKKLKARSYKILIGAADASFYYFDDHMITPNNPDGFLSLDFKKIAR